MPAGVICCFSFTIISSGPYINLALPAGFLISNNQKPLISLGESMPAIFGLLDAVICLQELDWQALILVVTQLSMFARTPFSSHFPTIEADPNKLTLNL